MIKYQPLTIAGYEYPTWAQALGWFIALMSVACIPAGMVHAVYKAKGGNLLQVSYTCTKLFYHPCWQIPASLSKTGNFGRQVIFLFYCYIHFLKIV